MGKRTLKLIPGDREAGAMEEQVAKFHKTKGQAPFGKDLKEAKPTVLKGKRYVGYHTRGKATGYKL